MNDLESRTSLSAPELSKLLHRIALFGQGEAERAERDEREAACVALCPWCDPKANHDPFLLVKPAAIKPRWDGYWHFCQFTEGDAGGTWRRCEASAIRARESQPVAPATCCGCDGPLGVGFFHENCVCLAKLGKPGCKHWVPEPVAPAEPPDLDRATEQAAKRLHKIAHKHKADPECADCDAAPLSPSPPTETPEKVYKACPAVHPQGDTPCGGIEGHGGEHYCFDRGRAAYWTAPAPREKERE